jgi:hypothetical protein
VNAEQFQVWARAHGACYAGRRWARGKSFAQAWKTCRNRPYMLWVISKFVDSGVVPKRVLIRAVYGIAIPAGRTKFVRGLLPDPEKVGRKAWAAFRAAGREKKR